MRWRKLGKIFDFAASPYSGEFVSHAQSPQALPLEDRIRIYFSTRKRDRTGKYLSHVRYVDYDLALERVLEYAQGEVIPLGERGTFNEHGIFPFSPLQDEGRILAYTTGWTRRNSVDTDSGIGLARSEDGGRTFRPLGPGPVLSASLREPFLVCDGFARRFGGLLHMFYIYGTAWRIYPGCPQPERTYVIGHGVSEDGIGWRKEGRQVIPSAYEGECQALPTVLRIGERYHMYFCSRNSVGFRDHPRHGYRIGYAFSDDLDHWVRDDGAAGIGLSEDGWDSEMMCYPHIFRCGQSIYLLYNGNAFGRECFGAAVLEDI